MENEPEKKAQHDISNQYFENKERGEKWPEPTVCKLCRAVYRNGKWSWEDVPDEANEIICPACQRYEYDLPMAKIDIRGPFFRNHKDEILEVISYTETRENQEYPMERIMSISDKSDHTVVTTTGIHIAKRIAEILHQSFDGELEFIYQEANDLLNVVWKA